MDVHYQGKPRNTDDDLFLVAFPCTGHGTGRDPVVSLYRLKDSVDAYYSAENAPPRAIDTLRRKGESAKRGNPPSVVPINGREGALEWLRSQLKPLFPELVG
jgi:hypothetical protein